MTDDTPEPSEEKPPQGVVIQAPPVTLPDTVPNFPPQYQPVKPPPNLDNP